MQIATFMAWMEATRNMYIKKSNGIVLEGPTNAGKTMILNTLLGTMELEPIPRTNDNSSFHLDQLIFATRVLFEEPCTIQALAGTDEHMTILLTKWMKLFVSKNGIVLASVDESYDIVTDKSVGLTPAMWVQMFTECEAIITTMPNKINDANELLSLDMHILADRHGFRPEYGQLDYSNLKRLIDKHCKGTIVIVNGEEKANVLRKYHQPTINAAVLGIPAWTSISMGYRTVAFMKIIAYYFLYFKIYVCLSYDLETSKNNFHYVNEFDFENTDPDGEIGYFFIVDLEYPHQIHDDTADFPLAPEHMLIDDSLLTDFMNVDLKYPHAIHDEIVDLPLAQEHMKIYDSLLTEYMTAQPNKEKPSEKLLLNQFDKIEYKRGMMIKSFDDNDRLLPDKCIGISSDMFRKLFFEMESDITQQPLISSDVLDEIQRLEDALTADGNDGGPVLERMVNIELEKEIPPALGETSIPSTSQQSEPTISRADISSDQPLTSSDVLSEIKRLEFDIDANRQPSLEKNGYH
ncbi:Non-structural protein NS1 [Nymphon striatum]|nr:Non-structural protein NS1 [Nymphon striatum]